MTGLHVLMPSLSSRDKCLLGRATRPESKLVGRYGPMLMEETKEEVMNQTLLQLPDKR